MKPLRALIPSFNRNRPEKPSRDNIVYLSRLSNGQIRAKKVNKGDKDGSNSRSTYTDHLDLSQILRLPSLPADRDSETKSVEALCIDYRLLVSHLLPPTGQMENPTYVKVTVWYQDQPRGDFMAVRGRGLTTIGLLLGKHGYRLALNQPNGAQGPYYNQLAIFQSPAIDRLLSFPFGIQKLPTGQSVGQPKRLNSHREPEPPALRLVFGSAINRLPLGYRGLHCLFEATPTIG